MEKENFILSKLYDEDSNQSEIYEQVGKKAFHDFVEGYDTTIFSYGNLGTGKTYSMIGSDEVIKFLSENSNKTLPFSLEQKAGIIPRICIDIMKHLEDLQIIGNVCKLKVSFLENYQNTINCLISGKNNVAERNEIKRVFYIIYSLKIWQFF